jgi:NAD(P)-dependent dehydrogenase (short-subunit alcohol dehydrogenase family)
MMWRHLLFDTLYRLGRPIGFVRTPDLLPDVVRPIPLGRVGRPDEIVGTAVYLLSDASSYTTRSLLIADGGAAAG